MKRSKPHPTIYDVSKTSGISISTISRVLNAPEKVSPETLERVIAAIDQLGYVPKAEARARALQGTGRIGVLTPFFTAPAFVQRLQGIASALAEHNGQQSYELVIFTVDSASRLAGYLATIPLIRHLDGLIIMALPLGELEGRRLVEHHLETVLIGSSQVGFPAIKVDDITGGRLAADYLIRRGHRRMAFLGGPELPEYVTHPASQRLLGFRQELEAAAIGLPPGYIFQAPENLAGAHQALRQLLALPEPPSAIFVASDLQAIGVLRAAREVGLKNPADLAVIGFDDLEIAEYFRLTTVRQPLEESGRAAVELLFNRLAGPDRPVRQIELPLTVIARETA